MKTKYHWKMDGFLAKVGLDVEGMQITQYIAENIFQLDPPPPELSENTQANDYILKALETKDLRYFDDLGAHFELTTAGGAEKAYRKAVDHLARLLVEDNAIGAVTVKQKKLVRRKKEIAAAVYEYQADYDGEWGEIEIDFEKGTGKISYIAELDTTRSHRFANKAIEEILNSDLDDLPKQKTIAFTK